MGLLIHFVLQLQLQLQLQAGFAVAGKLRDTHGETS